MPDGGISKELPDLPENDVNYKKRQHLITFGHNQWGFKNWNWSVSKQELDFIDFSNGKFCAGVVAFVSVNVTSLGLHREDVGYATTLSPQKGSAIYNARKASVTNALRETLLGFGGKVATQLLEQLEQFRAENEAHSTEKRLNNVESSESYDSKNIFNKTASQRKDSSDGLTLSEKHNKSPQRFGTNQHSFKNVSDKAPNFPLNQALVKPAISCVVKHNPKIAPMPPSLATVPGNGPPLSGPQHPSNVSYLVQHVMPPFYSVQCGAPNATPPPMYRNTYFTEIPPWPMYDNRVNFNIPTKSFANRSPLPRSPEPSRNYITNHPFNMNNPWIKPTIFYDGFWTEREVQKWVAEHMDKIPVVEGSRTSDAQKQMFHSKV